MTFSRTARALLALGALVFVLPATAGAAAWLPGKTLAPASPGASAPKVAMDAAGNAVAVWTRLDGSNFSIRVSRRPFGGQWSAQKSISAPGQISSFPQIAMTPSGRALVTWVANTTPTTTLKSRMRSAAGVWGPIQNVAISPIDINEPHLAMNSAGNAVAVWSRSNAGHLIVQASTRPANGAWSLAQTLSVLTEDAARPQAAMDSAGNAIAVWAHTLTASFQVQSAFRPAGGAWGAPQDVSVAGLNADLTPQVVLGPGGQAIAIWRRWDGSNRIIQSSTRSAAGVWAALPQDVSAIGQSAYDEQLARDAAGNVIAVWMRSNGTNNMVQAASRPVGSGIWQVPVDLSAAGTAGQDAGLPRIAMNPGGSAVAVWHRFNGTTHYFVQAAVRSPAGAWGATKNLSPAGIQSINAEAAIDPHGFAVAAWYRFTATTSTPLTAVYQGTLCTVPKLVGKPLAKAKTALKKAHCRAGTIKRAHSAKPAGRVISQAKPKGTKLLGNAKVKLVVSLGA